MANSKCRWECPQQWSQWSEWLAAGLHARNRWRLPLLLMGMLFANGRRTVTSWLRAAGISDDYQDYYYFLTPVGRKSKSIATQLVTLTLRTLPLLAMLYVRKRTRATIPTSRGWGHFATKLQLAARLVEWIVPLLKQAGKEVWIVIDGGYTKRPFLRRAQRQRVTIVGRLRKDAALKDLPPKLKKGQRRRRGRPRKYGKHKISLAKRAGQQRGWKSVACVIYGKATTKTYKTFLATYAPVGPCVST